MRTLIPNLMEAVIGNGWEYTAHASPMAIQAFFHVAKWHRERPGTAHVGVDEKHYRIGLGKLRPQAFNLIGGFKDRHRIVRRRFVFSHTKRDCAKNPQINYPLPRSFEVREVTRPPAP